MDQPSSPSLSLEKSTTVRTQITPRKGTPGHVARTGFRVLSRVAPSIAARAAEQVFRTPRRFAAPAREKQWRADAEALSIRYGLRPLRGWSWGQGEDVILLVHGWEGRGSQLGAFAQPLVAAGYRVIAFDAKAHGDSPGRRSSIVEFADGLWAVHRQLSGEGRLRGVIAHSMGAAATSFALAEGLDVERAVFIAPPNDIVEVTERFAELIGISPQVRDQMQASIERRISVPFSDLDLRALEPSRPTPLLVVHDQDDKDVPFAAGASVAEHWPGAKLLATSGLGHRRILRDETVVAEVQRFFTPAR